jgi:cell division protein ZapA (FtsZ GTPase activity inhibitor)
MTAMNVSANYIKLKNKTDTYRGGSHMGNMRERHHLEDMDTNSMTVRWISKKWVRGGRRMH